MVAPVVVPASEVLVGVLARMLLFFLLLFLHVQLPSCLFLFSQLVGFGQVVLAIRQKWLSTRSHSNRKNQSRSTLRFFFRLNLLAMAPLTELIDFMERSARFCSSPMSSMSSWILQGEKEHMGAESSKVMNDWLHPGRRSKHLARIWLPAKLVTLLAQHFEGVRSDLPRVLCHPLVCEAQ